MQPLLQIATYKQIELLVELRREFQLFFNESFDETTTRDAFRVLLQEPSLGRVWLIQVEQQIVGYLVFAFDFSIEFGGKTAFIDEFFIKDNYRQQGLGQEVLRQVIEAAKTEKIKALHLEVDKSNLPAQRLYQKVGFSERKYSLMTKILSDE